MSLVPRRPGFPWGAPSWPASVPRPPAPRRTGVDYDTSWARRSDVRLARSLMLDGVGRPLAALLARPTVHGLDRLDDLTGPVVFAANHSSHVDTPLVLTTLPQAFRYQTAVAAGADYFFDKRWKAGMWAFLLNAIPIERTRVSPRSMRLALDVLTSGWSLVIFPEGGRSPDGWGRPHRAGAAYLSQRTATPVVPVHLEGTRQVLRKGAKTLTPARTTVSYGAPLRVEPDEDVRDYAARIERAVAVLADEQATDWWTASRRAATGDTPALTSTTVSGWRRSWEQGGDGRRPGTQHRWP